MYPIHGGWMGNNATILAFDSFKVYDALAPEFNTYGTIVELSNHKLGIVEETFFQPTTYSLTAFPNPFNSSCMITAPEGAEIEICDLNGKYIEAFDKTPRVWTPDKSIASGIYLVRATVGNHSVTKKLVLIK